MWKKLLILLSLALMLSVSSAQAQNVRFGFSFGLLEQIDTSNFATAPFPFGQLQVEIDASKHFSVRIGATPFILVNQINLDGLYYFENSVDSLYFGIGVGGTLSISTNTNFGIAPRVITGYRFILSSKTQFFIEGEVEYALSLTYPANRFIALLLYIGFMFSY